MYGTPQPGMPWPSKTVSTCFCRSIAMEMARRTRTSLKGGLSWARARPNGASTLFISCTTARGRGFRQVVREQPVGSLEVNAQRVLVGRLHSLDLAERERLHAFLGVGIEAILDVGRHQLASVQGRHVLPSDTVAQLERPHAVIGV